MKLPSPRGLVSTALLDILHEEPGNGDAAAALMPAVTVALEQHENIATDEDLQLALFCLYELHYGGLDGVDERWEWNPGLIACRQSIEEVFEAALRVAVDLPPLDAADSDAVAAVLFELTGKDGGPSMSRFLAGKADLAQLREFLVHKSIYQLKEADPHTFAIPRLAGRPKAALVEIQADEYGGGRPERMHSALFARTMRTLELDDSYGAYVDAVPALSLTSVNMMSMFGLNRRLRGAIVGHLAAYEMTSSQPNRLYSRGFRRHGFGESATGYFDEHVEADAVHEQIAGRDLAGGLFEAEPALLPDIYFGAAAALVVDQWLAEEILTAWENGASSLRLPLMLQA